MDGKFLHEAFSIAFVNAIINGCLGLDFINSLKFLLIGIF